MPILAIWNLWFVLSPVLGLLIGSFLNVCIYRLPKGETVVKGHSYCPSCGHTLQALDLVPVFSYLFLRGRCRYCRAVISPRYMLIELWACLYTFIAVRAFSPSQPWVGILMPTHATQSLWLDWQALLLGYSMAFAFYIFLIWAMILKDRKKLPVYLYGWLTLPIIIRFIYQPASMISHTKLTMVVMVLTSAIWLIKTHKPSPIQSSHKQSSHKQSSHKQSSHKQSSHKQSKHKQSKHNQENKQQTPAKQPTHLTHLIIGTLLMLFYGGYSVLVLLALVWLINRWHLSLCQKKGQTGDTRFADSQAALLLFLASISWIFF